VTEGDATPPPLAPVEAAEALADVKLPLPPVVDADTGGSVRNPPPAVK
jgi:hypothetical protein